MISIEPKAAVQHNLTGILSVKAVDSPTSGAQIVAIETSREVLSVTRSGAIYLHARLGELLGRRGPQF